MTETAFCPAPHCQRQRPYTVGEDGMRRCGYCRKELGMEENLGAQTEMALEPVLSRLARLEMRADASAESMKDMGSWVGTVQERVTALETMEQVDAGHVAAIEARVNGLAASVNALLTRVTALEAAVAAEIAPFPSMPVPPPGGKSKPRAKKTPPRYPIKKR